MRLMEIRNMQEKHSTDLSQVKDALDDQNEHFERNFELLKHIDARLEKDRQCMMDLFIQLTIPC